MAHPNDDWYVFTVLGNKAGTGLRQRLVHLHVPMITRAAIQALQTSQA